MYFRALFDRIPHSKDEVNFKKGDILFVTDTMYNGHMGCWRACLVNEEDAQKRDIGMIPSRMKYVFIVNPQSLTLKYLLEVHEREICARNCEN